MGDREDELTVGAGRHADRSDAAHAGQVALEASDARHADEPGHDHTGRRDVGGRGVVLGDESGQPGRQGVLGDRRDLVIGVGGLGGEGGRFGLGGSEVLLDAQRREPWVGLGDRRLLLGGDAE